MADSPPRLHTRRLVLLLWILVIVFYTYMSYDYIRVQLNDSQLNTYLDFVAQMAGNENRPAKEVRTLILIKAEELGLPIKGNQILVTGERQNLKVFVSYDVDVRVPVFKRVLYHKVFEHVASFHELR